MKTAPSKIMSLTGKISVMLVFGAFLLFMAQCQKEETFAPTNKSMNENALNRPYPNVALGAPMIIIEHRGNGKLMPEYNVLIMANGTGIFNGWKNTYVIGQEKFIINQKLINLIDRKFIESGLYATYPKVGNGPDNAGISADLSSQVLSMPPEARPVPSVFSKPVVYTSYSVGPEHLFITLMDNNIRPAELISLRIEVEQMLNIGKYVNGEPF